MSETNHIYVNRSFLIFNTSEINYVNFNEILETGIDTLRKSVDGTKTFIKWDGDAPSFIGSLTTKEGPYNYNEMLSILDTSEWIGVDNSPI